MGDPFVQGLLVILAPPGAPQQEPDQPAIRSVRRPVRPRLEQRRDVPAAWVDLSAVQNVEVGAGRSAGPRDVEESILVVTVLDDHGLARVTAWVAVEVQGAHALGGEDQDVGLLDGHAIHSAREPKLLEAGLVVLRGGIPKVRNPRQPELPRQRAGNHVRGEDREARVDGGWSALPDGGAARPDGERIPAAVPIRRAGDPEVAPRDGEPPRGVEAPGSVDLDLSRRRNGVVPPFISAGSRGDHDRIPPVGREVLSELEGAVDPRAQARREVVRHHQELGAVRHLSTS